MTSMLKWVKSSFLAWHMRPLSSRFPSMGWSKGSKSRSKIRCTTSSNGFLQKELGSKVDFQLFFAAVTLATTTSTTLILHGQEEMKAGIKEEHQPIKADIERMKTGIEKIKTDLTSQNTLLQLV